MKDTYSQLVSQIIKSQEEIIGPVAFEQARKVRGLTFTENNEVIISGDTKDVLEGLVNQYAKLFGQASIEVCRNAVKTILPNVSKDQIPQVLL